MLENEHSKYKTRLPNDLIQLQYNVRMHCITLKRLYLHLRDILGSVTAYYTCMPLLALKNKIGQALDSYENIFAGLKV